MLTNGAVILTSNGKTMTNEQLLPPGTTAPNFTCTITMQIRATMFSTPKTTRGYWTYHYALTATEATASLRQTGLNNGDQGTAAASTGEPDRLRNLPSVRPRKRGTPLCQVHF